MADATLKIKLGLMVTEKREYNTYTRPRILVIVGVNEDTVVLRTKEGYKHTIFIDNLKLTYYGLYTSTSKKYGKRFFARELV